MKLKKYALLCSLFACCCCSTGWAAEPKTTVLETRTDKVMSVEEMVESFTPYNAVFFGEYHDQDILHQEEYKTLKKMYKKYGKNLVLSMEMFEADNQKILNEYLAGTISEEEFLKSSRPWPNYKTDYRQMIEFAKIHKIPVVAANIPRFLASKLAKEGNLDSVEEKDRKYLPVKTSAPEGAYKEKFVGYMTGRNAGMKVPTAKINQVFAAQCIKDDKMAESISKVFEENAEAVVLHINGCFHSDGHLGTVERLEQLQPELKVAVITPKDLPADNNYLARYENDKADGEYVIYFKRSSK